MLHNSLLFLQKWFQHYVQSFYSTDEQLYFHVRLKEEHTLRVMQHGSDIGRWLAISPEQLKLAEIATLLHDIGRFKQYQIYRTFNDGLSINHAKLGLDVLEEANILTSAGLSVQQQDVVKQAVLYHNLRYLPQNLSDECVVLSKITRDADKLDIFSMLVTDEKENQIPEPPELTSASGYSDFIIQELLQGNLIEPKEIVTPADLMLFRLSWIYDINYTYSFSYILRHHYIEKMIGKLPATNDIQGVYSYIKKYAEEHAIA
ncbi:HD domain-containing protein [Pelosinus sp. sgz500959]|uniref:HD domain-containing protein n=1 Tax=Pelosinus sp. sgz500959 TaxID=3242472 RepID=UPI00366CE3E9